MTKGAGEQSRGVSGIKRHTLTRVVRWRIVPFYVAGICTSYVLQHRVGLLGDNSVENAVLLVGFSDQKARCLGCQESRPFLPLFVQASRRKGGSREVARRKIGEEDRMGDTSGEGLAHHIRA